VLNTRRPAPVTAAIAAAAYRYFLAKHEGSDSVELAIEAMSTLVLPRFRSLFAQGVGIREPDAVKAFALHDAYMMTHERGDYAQRRLDQWLAIPMPTSDAEYVRAINAFAVPILNAVAPVLSDSTKSRLHIALESFHASDFETAFSVALEASADDPFRRAALLCDTAFELDTLAARSAAAEAVAALPEATRTILLKRRTAREVIASLKRGIVDLVAPEHALEPVPVLLPQNWTDWLRSLHDCRLSVGTLRAVARSGVDEWTVDDLLAKPDCPESFVEALKAEMPTEGEFLLREHLPIMIGFFARDAAFPRRELVHVYGALFEWDSMLTEGGLDELAALLEVLSGMLRLGLSDAEYVAVLETLSELVARYHSAKQVSWMLDLLELLVVHPAGSVVQRSRRTGLLHLIASFVVGHDHARRITSSQRRLLNALCVELGEAESFPLRDARDGGNADSSDPLQSILSRRVLGIYTLSEQSGERAARIVLAAVPTCRVILNSDKVCTTRLRNFARSSDLIVVVAGRATHAATDCISQHARGSGACQILYAAGNGTTGIMTSLEEAGSP